MQWDYSMGWWNEIVELFKHSIKNRFLQPWCLLMGEDNQLRSSLGLGRATIIIH